MANDLRLSGAQTSAQTESDVRFNYGNPSQIAGASNNAGGSSLTVFWSSDSGATWSQTNLPTVTGSGDAFQSDPTMDWTSDGTAWSIAVGVNAAVTNLQIRAFKSTDGGASWTFDATISGAQTATDKPNLWVDHSASSPHRDNIYALWWDSGPTYVARRTGPSGSWQAPQQVSGTETSGGSDGGDIKTNTFGDVFAFWPSEGTQELYVAKSTNGGVNFGTPVKIAATFGSFKNWPPAQDSRGCLLYITAAAYRTATRDEVYACWADLDGGSGCNSPSDEPGSDVTSACKIRIWFARSTDGGATWGAPVKINDQTSKNDQFFPRLALDETTGDLMVVYYDTVNDPGRLQTDVWMQTSSDGGVTWRPAVQVTSAESNETTAGANPNQYGDYIGLTGYAGAYFACWTDSRNGVEEIWGAPLIQPSISFELVRDHYGQDEIDGLRSQPGGPVVKTAFRLRVDGFTAAQLGITGPGSTNVAPPVAFSPMTGIAGVPSSSLDSSDPAFPAGEFQRFRFGYDVNFGPDDSAFTSFAGLTETVTLTATLKGLSAAAQVTFMKQPDPYIEQGAQTWWLSSDIRLVQVAQGDVAFGVRMGTDPQQFLTQVTQALESGTAGVQGVAGGENFDANTGEDTEVITVAPQTRRGSNLVNVYNFAIARVHYQGKTQPAPHVRVFFRLFAANSTATSFQPGTTYRRYPATYPVLTAQYGQPITPVPGVIAGEYVTVPCFAANRASPAQAGAPNTLPSLQLAQDPDTFNDRTLAPTGGPLHDTFYGCFLDINQSAGVLPQGGAAPAGNSDGPWSSGSGVTLEPLAQTFIRNAHNCLVAEIAFDPDPINIGTEPYNSDKFAQRNITWSPVANPGTVASRQAIENFEVRPSPVGGLPDELVIDWGNAPVGGQAEIYLPAVDADAVLATASRLYPFHQLSLVDPHTIGCPTGGVTYIPLPPGSGTGENFAGLMSVGLPAGIRRGELYTVLVQQFTSVVAGELASPELTAAAARGPAVLQWRRAVGIFQVNIPVSTKSAPARAARTAAVDLPVDRGVDPTERPVVPRVPPLPQPAGG